MQNQTPAVESIAAAENVIFTSFPRGPARLRYSSSAATVLGSCQIGLGIFAIIFQILGIFVTSSGAVIGHGIWCGVFFITAGSFQIESGKRKSKPWVITAMVFCILAAFPFDAVFFSLCVVAFYNDIEARRELERLLNCDCFKQLGIFGEEPHPTAFLKVDFNQQQAVSGSLVCLSVLELIIAVAGAIYTCKPFCCDKRDLQPVAKYFTQNAGPFLVPNQPMYPASQFPDTVAASSREPSFNPAFDPKQKEETVP